jgi:cytosine/adenosine deaminase-related metal-dependent hydrolase
MRKIVADSLFDGKRVWRDTCIVVNDAGVVQQLAPASLHPDAERLHGTLAPGLINAHCHLELSHLWGQLPQGTGMAAFAKAIIGTRNDWTPEAQAAAAAQAMDQAWQQGTVAIIDISNQALTAPLKLAHPLYTHTCVELLGALPERADAVWQQGQAVAEAFADLPHSLVPHAPYSVSLPLQLQLAAQAEAHNALWAMHFMESAEETAWLQQGTGPMAELLAPLGAASPLLDPVTQLLQYLPQASPALLVHCTECAYPELAALAPLTNVFFALCPRSNRYIHEQAPYYDLFPWEDGRVCLGTDSLASNHDLNLWAEVAAVAPQVGLVQALQAATSNAAELLQLPLAGNIGPGTAPGIVHWEKDIFSLKVYELKEVDAPQLCIAPNFVTRYDNRR